MSMTAKLAPHLPFLRRYARALTGNQTDGDQSVRGALAGLAAGDLSLDEDLSPRVALYHLFHLSFVRPAAGAAAADGAGERLLGISPASRQAFLLTAMEGFTVSETAAILAVEFDAVGDLVAQALREIDAELATTVLIIEDEPVIAADIQALVMELGHEVSEVATTRTEARAAAARVPPGLILADIQLADGSSGIDAVNDILAVSQTPVIFITAFPERLLTGERPEPAFLITKPFEPATVKAAIGQALFFNPRRRTAQ
jgi:CheY-like chemotaxis protein